MKKLDKKNIENILALTPTQEGMLFHYLKNREGTQYSEQLCLDISGEIDIKRFEKTWQILTETNEMLRTQYRWEKLEKPAQIIMREHKCNLYVYDLTDKNISRKKAALEEIKTKDRQKTFDPGRVPFRVSLCKIAGNKYLLIISNHHILYDGWSTGIILKEFFHVYHALSSGNQQVTTPAKPSFKEFIQWLHHQDKTKQKQFWTGYLAGFESPTRLPVKTKRKEAREIKDPGNYTVILKRSIKDQLEIFIKNHRVTMASFFFSAWGILLQRYCNSEDVIFGTTVSGRSAPIKGIRDMVGLFINTIPLRIKTGKGEKIKDLLYRVNNSLPEREKYESTPLVDIKEYSQLENNVDLFDSLIVMENYPLEQNLMKKNSQLPLVVDSYSIVESTNYDLAISITVGEVIGINFIHNPLSLKEQSISRLSPHFNRIIESVLKNSMGDISGIEILSEEEKKELIYDFNDTEAAYPQNKTIHVLFAEQAEITPDNIALLGFHETHEKHKKKYDMSHLSYMSYKELNEQSNQLARLLLEKDVKRDTIVGIMVHRSMEMVTGILGILKAGGAYLPIDPDYPQERIKYMLKDSNVGVLVTTPKLQVKVEVEKNARLPGLPLQLVHIHTAPEFAFEPSISTLTSTSTCQVSPANLAYIIYTSGSTGQPKGVMVGHSPVANLLWALQNKYPFRESDVYLLKTSYFFDVSVCELFGWFFGGGRLAVLEKNGEKNPQIILDTIETARVTHINFVPSMFKVFTDALNPRNIKKLSSLRYIFLAGEALLPHLIDRFKRLNKIIALENIYGPTEATVYAGWYSLSPWSGGDIVPIGKPLPNVQLFILGSSLNLQPVGVPGELSIAGTGLARGYLNNQELTAERFLNGPRITRISTKKFNKKLLPGVQGGGFLEKSPPGRRRQKIYRTGDLARWLPDGNVDFLGRMDRQVKIRGLRIELEEIENQLAAHHQIKEAVVTARQDNAGDGHLVAYIVPGSTGLADPDKMNELRSNLYLELPTYMIPSHFVLLEKIPLTPSGKVDRKALPEPGITSKKIYIAPNTETEMVLAGLWSGVLGIGKEKISVNDNFFELGGHSLKVAGLISRIHKAFNIEIPYSKFFQFPSIRGIVSYIKEVETHVYQPISRAELKEYYPLSNPQKQFYVAQQVKHGDTSYNMYETMHMKGILSRERLEAAFRQLLLRHESLRMSFHMVNGEPVQEVNRDVVFNIEYYDGETVNKQEPEKITRDFFRPFDLTRAPLWRVGLVKTASDEHLLMVNMNHIIADGTSVGIFIRDFNAIYNHEPLPTLTIDFRDYLEWYGKQREETRKKSVTSSALDGFEEFETEYLTLPTDFPRPSVPDFAGKAINFNIGIDRVKALYDFSIEHDVTLYTILLAAFNILLAKLSNQDTIAVGSPMAGRLHVDLDNLMGLFLNILCLRNRPGGEKQFLTFLQEVKERTAYAYDHQEYQYDEMITGQKLARDMGRNPLYSVMLVLQNMEMSGINIPGLTITREVGDYFTSKFDITLYCEEKDPVVFKLEYSTALFKQDTIHRFIRYFEEIISRVLENPHQEIADIEILPAQEKLQILYDFNDTKVKYPDDRCIYQLIETQSRKTPDQIALKGKTGPKTGSRYPITLTYKELNERANHLAHLLKAKGIQADDIVGIMLERSLSVVWGILAILKAGGAYLPLDPEYPEQRIVSMLKHSRSSLVLTHKAIMKEKPLPSGSLSPEVVEIEEMEELFGKQVGLPKEDLEPVSGPGNLIYIIFTSGSTGIPKGAGVYHRGFVNLLHWFVTEFELSPPDRNLLLTSLSFDLTQKNLYASLITGGTLCVPGVGYFDPHSLLRQIREQGVTWINCTPSMFYKMVEHEEAYNYEELSGLRYVFLGGEPIAMSFLLPWLESEACRTEIVNTYGPTECTDICNSYRVKQPHRFMKEPVPLGKPVYNVQLYIVDRHLHLTSVGVAGELTIGGAGVGKGYINDKNLTVRKFITHSFDPEQPPQLLYKTGDLVKWLPDGNMVFLGRIDHQVKIRGFRIEPGEIEKRLMDYKAVKEAVVVVREEKNNEKNLCAYVVPHPGASLQIPQLREYLSRELPGYMVPAYVIQLEKIPLNPNGKVDRKSLPEPQRTTQKHIFPPQNRTEHKLAEIWAEVLKLDKNRISIDDNFFHLGGHSLKATALVGNIYKELKVEIPLPEVFRTPTIRGLAVYIDHQEQSLYTDIRLAEQKEYYALSSVQKRLYALWQMETGSIVYNISLPFLLEGNPGKNKLGKIFKELIHRHESLRTSFEVVDIEPVQRIHEEVKFEIEYDQVVVKVEEERSPVNRKSLEAARGLAPWSEESAARLSRPAAALISSFIRPLQLSRAPLLRVGLIKLLPTTTAPGGGLSQERKEDRYLLIVDMHHIISDGISSGILVKEFMALAGEKKLPDLKLQYKDYSEWQKDEKHLEVLQKQGKYWERQFTDEIPVLDLPTDFPRPAIQSFDGSVMTFETGKETTAALKSLAQAEGTTLYMILLTIYNIFLSKLSSQEDIIVGTPTAARRHPDLGSIMGMFVNTLVLRNYPRGDKSFISFLKEITERTLEAFDHQDYLFEDLVEKVVVNRDLSRNPLFDVMFILQNVSIPGIDIPGLKLSPFAFEPGTSKFDLTFTVEEPEEKLIFTVEFNTKLFLPTTIQGFINYFKKIVSDVLNNKDIRIWKIELVSEKERRQLLYDFNDTTAWYPKDQTIQQLFENQLEQTPDHTALVGQMTSITYGELNEKANQLARELRKQGITPNTPVGIMMERSLEMLPAILAVLKAGGAYLPIDPQYPGKRVNYMLKDSGAKILLTSDAINRVPTPQHLSFRPSTLPPFYPSNPSNLAYIIYTSGSTGKPKGVMVEHISVINVLLALQKQYPLIESDACLLKTSITFDVSVAELFGWFFNGGRLVILGKGQEKDPEIILNSIAHSSITHINFVPSMFNTFLNILNPGNIHKLSSLKYIFLAGEALLPDLIKRFRRLNLNSDVLLENIYGPTENTIYTSSYSLSEWEEKGTIPIGKPLPNVRLYILNRYDHLQPLGIPGELCIGGAGLARGYLNRPELTAERFCLRRPGGALFEKTAPPGPPCKNFLLKVPGKVIQGIHRSYRSYMSYILYQTGDLARWLPDGNVEFLGRIDHQVKVRGFRIELGEIENQILRYKGIKETVVVTQEDERADKYLVAYIASLPGCKIALPGLREHLLKVLPEYMVPSHFMRINDIPLTPSGKVDRRALPQPIITPGDRYAAPRNEIEKKLVEIWEGVLCVKGSLIGIHDNFFKLGGHSLKATTLALEIRKAFNIKLPLTEIFKRPTVERLTGFIREAGKEHHISIEVSEKKEYYTLSSVQKQLYALHQLDVNSTVYNMPFVLLLEGKVDKDKLDDIFRKLTRRHYSLRTSFVMAAAEPVQRVHHEVELEIESFRSSVGKEVISPLNCQGRGEVSSPVEIGKIIPEFIRTFDLSQAPLLRVGLIKLPHTPNALEGLPPQEGDDDKYLLMIDMHHIISDGISCGILVKEFMALAGEEKLPGLRLQYKDYSEWQKGEKQRKAFKDLGNYWKQQFADEIPVLDLPTDFTRPAVQTFDGNHETFIIDKESTAALKSLALAQGTTLYMVLLAIYYILLAKLCSQEDIIIGTPTAGRGHPDLEPILGMFVNTLALRNYPNNQKSFPAFLKEIKERTLEAFDHQDYQYENLVDQVLAARDASRNPFFDTMFTIQNNAIPEIRVKGLKLTPLQYHGETSKFDLLLIGEEVGENLSFTLEYSTRLFTANTIRRFIGCFNKIVTAIIGNPAVKPADIEIISAEEKQQVLVDFNNTRREYPKNKTINELFKEQVERIPDNTAAVGPSAIKNRANRTHMTYISFQELNHRSNRLAYLLQTRGVKTDTIVAIMLERSLEMIIGILAILKAGGAYMPIDPDYPEERKQYMLKDSGTGILLKDIDFSPGTGPASTLLTLYPPGPANLAYIMYTSGSTGIPKGVMVNHRSVIRLVKNTNYVEFKENQRILQTGALEFDASTFEIWGALLNGLTLYLVDKGQILNPERLEETINKYHISTLWMTSPLFNQMVQTDVEIFARLTNLLVGGDALSPSHINRVRTRFPALKVINGYGPTENTTFSTTFLIDTEYANIPIGSPISNSTAIIIDKAHHLQPIKVAGELYVGGDGVSRGYLNDPELTVERFCLRRPGTLFKKTAPGPRKNFLLNSFQYPNNPIPHSPIYMTGDLARWLPDGNIEFLGRIDHQVKLRGFRVEPGEIENRLLSHKEIKDTVVLVKQNPNQEKYLCAYVVPENGYSPEETTSIEEELRNQLQQTLPNYMVPAYFITLNQLPLTPNGKIDRKALPEPETPAPGSRITAPQNPTQEKLTLIWGEILSMPSSRISIDSDFFEMGGHSLKALQVLNAIQKEFSIKMDFQDIFQYPTIAELSNLIRKSRNADHDEIEIQSKKEYYDLSYAQKRLWMLYQLAPGNPAFNLPACITLYEPAVETGIRKTLEKLVERHDSFRTYFKNFQGNIVQIIRPQIQVNLETFDLTRLEAHTREAKRNQLLHEENIKPFNLETPPLFRVKLIKCKHDEFDVALTMHHIITDGWSMEILEREFTLLYESYKTGRDYHLPFLKNHCVDYAYWQERLLTDKEKMQGAKEFWEIQLKGDHPILDLPYDFPKKNMQSKASAAYSMVIPEKIMLSLKKIAIEHKGSLFMVLLAGFNLLLYRITGQEDLLLGVPGAARQHEDLKNIVGFFVNTLILEDKIDPDESFIHFLLRVQDNTLKVLEYQSFPLELLCSEFKIRYPEIPVFFNMSIFGNTTRESLKSDTPLHLQTVQDAKFDIACYLGEYKNGITIETHYYKELFKPITIEKMMQLYRVILEDIARNPEKQVGEYQYSLTRQKRKLTFSSPARALRE
jgi:amino acid adenylation domain-containing protein